MSSSTAGPGGSTTERLQGSLRHSAIARLLVEGRLSTASSPAATERVSDRRRQGHSSSPPPPIDLSTNRTSANQGNDSAAAAVASFSLSTITTMQKLRCILSYEIQSLLSRGDISDQIRSGSSCRCSNSSSSCAQYSCRFCTYAASNVIELLEHYRLHGDTLAQLAKKPIYEGHKSPDMFSQWFDYYLKTSSVRCSSSQSFCAVRESLGVTTPSGERSSSPVTSRLDLRTLLLKPFKATSTLLLSNSSGVDRPGPSHHRACSESQPLRPACRAGTDGCLGGGTQSRSSTPYTMTSGLTDDENQLQTVSYAGDRCSRRGMANGRQAGLGGGIYPGEVVVSVKCEADDATTTSPVRSPLSTYSTHSVKDKGGANSQDSQSSGAEYLAPSFPNGRLQRLAEVAEAAADERSPPMLKCEVDRGSPYPGDRIVASHGIEENEKKYLTNLRDLYTKEAQRKSSSSTIARLLHPGVRVYDEESPSLGYALHPGPSVTPNKDTTTLGLDLPGPGQQHEAGKQSMSPAPCIQFRETVEQEYAYKQYKRLRKSNTPKSCRQETSRSPSQSLSKTPPDDSGLSRTPSLTCPDGSEAAQRPTGGVAHLDGPERGSCRSTERAPRGYDVGVQCSLISPLEPWIAMTKWEEEDEDDYDDDEEEDDDETREDRRSGMRCRSRRRRMRRKRAYPADENEMPDITASDADCVQMRCSPCGITFDDDVIFSIHMGCHSHTDPFVCNICGRPCDNKYAFNTHILRGHHPT